MSEYHIVASRSAGHAQRARLINQEAVSLLAVQCCASVSTQACPAASACR